MLGIIHYINDVRLWLNRLIEGVKVNQMIRSNIIKENINSFNIIQPLNVISIEKDAIIFECQIPRNLITLRLILQAYDFSKFVVKIIYNLGDDTSALPRNEYEILRYLQSRIQFHHNIIPLLHHFIDIPSDAFFSHFNDILRELGTHPNGYRRSCIAIITPLYPYSLRSFLLKHASFPVTNSELRTNETYLKLVDRLVICLQIANVLKFLFQNRIFYRNLTLDNFHIHLPSSLLSRYRYNYQNTNKIDEDGDINIIDNEENSENDDNIDTFSDVVPIFSDFSTAIKVEHHDSKYDNNRSNSSNNIDDMLLFPSLSSLCSQVSWDFGVLAYEIIFFGEHHNNNNEGEYSRYSYTRIRDLYDWYYKFSNVELRGNFGDEVANLLSPLLIADASKRPRIEDTYRSFLSFLKFHYPHHSILNSHFL